MNPLFRFLRLYGLLILGIIFAIGGIGFGAMSHQVVYHNIQSAHIVHYLVGSDNNKTYLQLDDGSLYYFQQTDFSPALNPKVLQSRLATLYFNPSDPLTIDANAPDQNIHLAGEAAPIVKLISYNVAGQNPQTFVSAEYTQHPDGFYQSNWLAAIAILLVGISLIMISLILRKRDAANRSTADPAAAPTLNAAVPSYQQPNQPAYQYAQQGQPSLAGNAYPAQAGPMQGAQYAAQPGYPSGHSSAGVAPTQPAWSQHGHSMSGIAPQQQVPVQQGMAQQQGPSGPFSVAPVRPPSGSFPAPQQPIQQASQHGLPPNGYPAPQQPIQQASQHGLPPNGYPAPQQASQHGLPPNGYPAAPGNFPPGQQPPPVQPGQPNPYRQ